MGLRLDAWTRLLDQADGETQATMIFMMALQDIYVGKSKFTYDVIDREAPDLIPPKLRRYYIAPVTPETFQANACKCHQQAFQGGSAAGTD